MKLIQKIALRLSMVLIPVIALWAMIFYFVTVEEINDEVDDLLRSYSEQLIAKKLANQELPVADIIAGMHYSISQVTEEYADSHPRTKYYDSDLYINETDEDEPARFLKTFFYDAEGRYFELIAAIPTFEKEDLIEAILWWIAALYLILLVTVIVITLAVFQKSIRPLYEILDWLNAYTPGKTQDKLAADTDIYEFRQLEKAVTEATDRSNEAYEKQKQFIGNASHELQTPLAVLGGRIDWMLDNDSLGEENIGELVKMKREVVHISRLNKTLLLLTKIDNGQFPDVMDVNLSSIVQSQEEMYEEIFSRKNIHCSLEMQDSPVVVRMNETLATILVTNLIKNAFMHSPDGGIVTIALDGNGLAVENSGEAPLDRERIFDRFYQGAKKEGSTGLGLALAKTIADKNGMQFSYSFADGRHRFRINFCFFVQITDSLQNRNVISPYKQIIIVR